MDTQALSIGQSVTWLHTPPGGYGYTLPVDGIITRINSTRIQIQVAKRDGSPALRWVKLDKLRPRKDSNE